MHALRTLPTLVLLLLGTASCLNTSPPGAVFSSTPPGARVVIDGSDSGFVTPCQIGLDHDENYRVRLELAGYEAVDFRLESDKRITYVSWKSANPWPAGTWWFPLFLDFPGLLTPVRIDSSHSPHRVHVRLDPAQAG